MLLTPLLRGRKSARARRHSRRPLGMERLEDRTLLSTFSFDSPVNLPILGSSTPATGDVVAGDFNEDGNPDIIGFYNDGPFPSNPARIAVFLATGPASYGSPTILTQTPGCWAASNGTMQVGDFNNDGHLDFSMTHGGSNAFCFGNKVTSHLGDGAGNFTLAQTFSTGGSISKHIIGDFTNDNNQDIVIPTHDSDTTFLHRGNGNGTFQGGSAAIGGVESSALVTHDFNGDGNLDLATGEPHRGRNSVRVYYGNGVGGLSLAQHIPLATPDGLVGADMDNDGILDLVATSGSTGNVSFLKGLAGGTFAAPVTFNTGLSTFRNEPVVADFDLDGNLDLALGDGVSALHVLAGDGSGGFALPQSFSLGAGSFPGAGLKAADLNLDGRPDLLTTVGTSGVTYLLNTSLPPNSPPVANAGGPYLIDEGGSLMLDASGSFDPDGDLLSFSWDVNGDSIFGDATGATPTLTAAELQALGIGDDGTLNVSVRVDDGQGGVAEASTTLTVLSAFIETVQIDVKPGSDPNSVNLASNGVIAVSILTTDQFDAALVDANTVVFAGAFAVQSALEDIDGDGDLDLVLHFRVQDTNLAAIYEQLLLDDLDGDGILDSSKQEAEVSLTGETVDSVLIEGFDTLDLFLSGKNLRALLEELASAGAI